MGKDIFKEIKKTLSKIGEIRIVVKGIGEFVEILKAQKFKTLGYGIKDLNDGFDAGIINLPKVYVIFMQHVGKIFADFGDFLRTYMECGLRGLKNLQLCFPYYFLQFLLIVVYFFTIQIWILIFGLQKYERMVWDKIYKFNDVQKKMTTIDFTKYPDSIINLCYKCEGGTLMQPNEFIETVKRHAHTLFHNDEIHRLMVEKSLQKMNDGARNIRKFFQKTEHEEQEQYSPSPSPYEQEQYSPSPYPSTM
jgi:hypothetical protein